MLRLVAVCEWSLGGSLATACWGAPPDEGQLSAAGTELGRICSQRIDSLQSTRCRCRCPSWQRKASFAADLAEVTVFVVQKVVKLRLNSLSRYL
jgi:hypothetical protein